MVSTDSLHSPMKIVLAGSSHSGKSCLVKRLLEQKWSSRMTHQENWPSCQVWTLSGAERYKILVSQFLDEANVIIVCLDMLDQSSLAESEFWVQEAKRVCPTALTILCGTKIDEADSFAIKLEDAQTRAKEWGVEFRSVSAKNKINISELFEYSTTK